jgi:hypothetical protein
MKISQKGGESKKNRECTKKRCFWKDKRENHRNITEECFKNYQCF